MGNINQIYLKRIYFLESLPLLLREAVYHRAHDEEEDYDRLELYNDGAEGGSLDWIEYVLDSR